LSAQEEITENTYIQVVGLITVGIQTHQEINRDDVRKKLDKEIETITNHMNNLQNMLSSEDFRKRAPANIIAEREKSLQDDKEKIAKLMEEKENIAKN